MPFAAGDDVAEALARLSAGSGEDGSLTGAEGAFESFVLEREGDGWRFEARLSDEATDAGLGDAGAGGGAFGDAIVGALLDDASFTVRLALPGDIVEHNADELSGGELVWHLDVLDPGARSLMARSEVSSGSGGVPSWVLIAGVVVVAVLLAAGAAGWAVREGARS